MIFITDQNCWFADPESPFFLSYDTGVSHQSFETKQYKSPSGYAIPASFINFSFGYQAYNCLYIGCFHRYSEVFCLTWCRSMVHLRYRIRTSWGWSPSVSNRLKFVPVHWGTTRHWYNQLKLLWIILYKGFHIGDRIWFK